MRSVKEVDNAKLKKNIRISLNTLGEMLNLIDDEGTSPECVVDNIENDLEKLSDDLILMYGVQEMKDKFDY